MKRQITLWGIVAVILTLGIAYFPAAVVRAATFNVPGDYPTIQAAVDAAVPGYIVLVAAGTYYENITLKDGVEVLGAGAAVTTINGGGIGSVVTAVGAGPGTKLDGFTITNGSADNGGGMFNETSSPIVTNCIFSGNSAYTWYGGGMYNANSSSPTVTNCTFSGNSGYSGGGMANLNGCSPTVTNCTFSGNMEICDGGGMANYLNSSPMVTNCTFTGNSAAWGGGGGLYNSTNCSPVVVNCTFSGNWAYGGGAIHNFDHSSPVVTNCTFWGNTSTNDLGGMMLNHTSSSPTIRNNIIVNNTATGGGGIAADDTSAPVIDYNDVWGNTPDDYLGCSPGTNDISSDPMLVNPSSGDCHLLAGSPCIDTGSNAAVPPWLTTDFQGEPRIADGDGDLNAVVDMGVDEHYELAPPTPPQVPTLSQWGMVVLVVLLAVSMAWALRKERLTG